MVVGHLSTLEFDPQHHRTGQRKKVQREIKGVFSKTMNSHPILCKLSSPPHLIAALVLLLKVLDFKSLLP